MDDDQRKELEDFFGPGPLWSQEQRDQMLARKPRTLPISGELNEEHEVVFFPPKDMGAS